MCADKRYSLALAMKRSIIVHILFPIAVGAAIYILFRPNSLLVFSWAKTAGLSELIESARRLSEPLRNSIPSWVIYSLPDGLWVYAMTAFFAVLWKEAAPGLLQTCWMLTGAFLGIGSETLQGFGLVRGAFDVGDVIAYSIGTLLAVTLVSPRRATASNHNQVQEYC